MDGFPLQYLKHGKALCGKVFGGFVETFNALVDFSVNVRGDADFQNGEGHVRFDRSDPRHPVIRCSGCGEGGSGGGGGSDHDEKSCFRLEKRSADGGGETVTQLVVVDCYYMAAGVMHKAADTNVSSLLEEDDEDAGGSDDEDSGDDADSGKILYFSLTDGGETFGTVPADELKDLMIDETKYVVPLYLFGSDGEVKVDLRTAQKLQVWDDAAGNSDEEDAE